MISIHIKKKKDKISIKGAKIHQMLTYSQGNL